MAKKNTCRKITGKNSNDKAKKGRNISQEKDDAIDRFHSTLKDIDCAIDGKDLRLAKQEYETLISILENMPLSDELRGLSDDAYNKIRSSFNPSIRDKISLTAHRLSRKAEMITKNRVVYKVSENFNTINRNLDNIRLDAKITYPLLAILFIVLLILVIRPNITGFATTEIKQVYSIDKEIDSYYEDNYMFRNDLTSIRVTGSIPYKAEFRIIVTDGNNEYVIVDNEYLEQVLASAEEDKKGITMITGLAIDENDTIASEPEIGNTAAGSNITEEIDENIDESIDNPVNETDNTAIAIISFDDICKDTCTLSNLSMNFTIIAEVDNSTLNFSSFSTTYIDFLANSPPELILNFTDIKAIKNSTIIINVRDHFKDIDGERLDYRVSHIPNATVMINRSIITIIPYENFTGELRFYIYADDRQSTVESNEIMIEVIDNSTIITQYQAEINLPVSWKKQLYLMDSTGFLTTDLPADSFNITVIAINDTEETALNITDLDIMEEGIIKDLEDYEEEKKLKNTEKEIEALKIQNNLIIEQEQYDQLHSYRERKNRINALEMELETQKIALDMITGSVVRDTGKEGKGLLPRFFAWLLHPTSTPTSSVTTDISEITMSIDKESYIIGEQVNIIITPEDANASIYTFSDTETYIVEGRQFMPNDTGYHSLSALITYGDMVEHKNIDFLVFASEEDQASGLMPPEEQAEDNLTLTEELIEEIAPVTEEKATGEVTLIISEDSLETAEKVELEYTTPPPYAFVNRINDTIKQVVITSDMHYENILSYVDLPDVNPKLIRLYQYVNDSKVPFSILNYTDTNNDTMTDRIYWITPHLSNQTFEIEIIVLNVQSYPAVEGNWTVYFDTFSTANLSIQTTKETTYSEFEFDLPETADDLEFLELRCGNETIFSKQENIYRNDVWIMTADGIYVKPNDLKDQPRVMKGIYVESYNCSETASFSSKVLTPGVHNQIIYFGDQVAYANNHANTAPITDMIAFSDGSLFKTKTFLG